MFTDLRLKKKTDKYTSFANDLRNTWKTKSVKIIPVVNGATGEIPKD